MRNTHTDLPRKAANRLSAALTATIALIALVALLTPVTAIAGPWARLGGQMYAKLSYADLRTDRLVTPDGEENQIPEFTLQQVLLYLEYGVGSGLTLSLDLPVLRRSEIDRFDAASGIGDLRLGIQRQLGTAGGWSFAVREVVQGPTGDETKGGGLLPTGAGVWELESILGAGRTFDQGRGYGFIELGYDWRGGDLRDGLLYEAQLGHSLGEHLSIRGFVRGLEPWDGRRSVVALGTTAGLGDGTTYLNAGGGLTIHLGAGWALELEAEAMPHARNIAPGPTLRLGLSRARR